MCVGLYIQIGGRFADCLFCSRIHDNQQSMGPLVFLGPINTGPVLSQDKMLAVKPLSSVRQEPAQHITH